MTANQIEYWKLQETRRHNIVTEAMDKPVKESQTAYNYASINLMREQAQTEETKRAMNLAAAANYYASAANQNSQVALNEERTRTEQLQQEYVGAQTDYVNAQMAGQELKNDYQTIVNEYAPSNQRYENLINMYSVDTAQFTGAKARSQYQDWLERGSIYAWGYNTFGAFNASGDNLVRNITNVVSMFAN